VFITEEKSGRRLFIGKIERSGDHNVWTKKAYENHVMRTGHFAVDKEAFDSFAGESDVFRVVTEDKEYFISAKQVKQSPSLDYGWGEQYFVSIKSCSSMTRANVKTLSNLVARGTFDL
jgi:hypothetical protein